MKAMILAAGLGTRLAPYTDHTPKPLFTINRRPVLDWTIKRLIRAGCRQIIVNTHHLNRQIEDCLSSQNYGIDISTRHEPEILGTGGGIANIADIWGQGPLLVVNADIVCDIELTEVMAHHREHGCPVTMVMHDHSSFNTVGVDPDDYIVAFGDQRTFPENSRSLAFTGIHVLEREVLEYLPGQGFASIIDAYQRMLTNGRSIKAMVVRNHYWNDIGTPERYREAAIDHMAPKAFESAFGAAPSTDITFHRLHGDGSDRRWFRLSSDVGDLILADHGIRIGPPPQEADAYEHIGRHLLRLGLPIPAIYLADPFSGLVFVQDVGDHHLQAALEYLDDTAKLDLYRQVIDLWSVMGHEGQKGFDTAWTYQTSHYDRDLILEKEARYFVEAFLQSYLGWATTYDDLAEEFELLANGNLVHMVPGFIHRDFQSRNIMVKNEKPYFIDFQGGRLGPIQYDLASLLIDPYARLSLELQDQLLTYAAERLRTRHGIEPSRFVPGFAHCAVTRNLQILGAFAFLSRVKGKTAFEAYIPIAVQGLQINLDREHLPPLPKLKTIVNRIASQGAFTSL
jgi:aminoglycoside/choline kinase family phosphotransferase/dTDP-glucose pyrophosphorylase